MVVFSIRRLGSQPPPLCGYIRRVSSEAIVQQLYLDGQRAWPELALKLAMFRAHYEQVRVRAAAAPYGSVDGAGLYLCSACLAGSPGAAEAFEQHCLEVARVAIFRIRAEPEFVQETLQEVWRRLLVGPSAKLADYSGRGPLQAWVRVAAVRLALDRCRAEQVLSRRQTELHDQIVSPNLSPELCAIRERYLPDFREALRAAVGTLSPEERNVLRMHVVGQCSIDEIGRAYNVHRATAARWLERTRTRIFEATRHRLSLSHGELTDSEFKSLAHGLASELSMGLTLNAARRSRSVAGSSAELPVGHHD